MTIYRSQRGDIHSARARGPFNKCQGSMRRTTEGRKAHPTSGSVWKLGTDYLEEDRERNSLYFSIIATYFEKFIYLLILVALGLCCCVQASSSCREWELLLVAVHGLPGGEFSWVASPIAEHRPSGTWASVVMAHRL